ncbi:cytochrome P450 CYP405A2, partial [Danaus plexippus plexippus]
ASPKLMEMWNRHGKQNFRLTIGSEDWIMLSDPDDVGTILNHPSELSKPLERNAAMKPFFGNSISSSEGEKWKSTRKLMTPSFHFKTLEKRVEDVNKHCDRLFKILDTFNDKSTINLYTYLRPYMLDILCSTLMGVDSNFLGNINHPYLEASGRTIKIITQNYFSYWRNISKIFELSPQYRVMIKTVKALRDTSATGHYTTTMTICHTLYCIAKYPDIQNRIIEEQRSIFKNNFFKCPTNQDLNDMKYLEAVLKESVRVIPTVTKIGRQLHEDLKFKGFRYAWVAMKATLSNMLRRYEVFPCDPADEPQFAHHSVKEFEYKFIVELSANT